jgi:polysaccharide deacetylase 2 family uncharacterized protein YibQ
MMTIKNNIHFSPKSLSFSIVVARNPRPQIRLFGTTTKAAVTRATTSRLLALLKSVAPAFLPSATRTAAVMRVTTSRLLALLKSVTLTFLPSATRATRTAAVMRVTTSRLLAVPIHPYQTPISKH